MFADLAMAVSELVDTTSENIVSRLESISLTAEVEEQPWLARFTRGLQGCVLLVVSPEPWRAESCASLIDECIRSGDDWGASLLSLALGVAHAARGDDAAIAWLDKAAAGAAALSAPVVQAWAETLGAATAKRLGAPDLEARSARATALSRSAGLRTVEPVLERLAEVPHDPSSAALASCRRWGQDPLPGHLPDLPGRRGALAAAAASASARAAAAPRAQPWTRRPP